MTDILDEVIQEERERKKYKKIKTAAPVVVAIMILSIAGAWFYNDHMESKKQASSKMSASVMRVVQKSMIKDDPAADNMQVLLSSIDETHIEELAELGQLIYAVNLIEQEKNAQALKAIEIAAGAKNSIYVRNYARMLWIFNVLDSGDKFSQNDQKKLEEYFNYFSNEDVFCYGPVALARAHYLSLNSRNDEAIKVLRAAIGSDIDAGVKFQAKTLLSSLENK